MPNSFHLERFIESQNPIYNNVLAELQQGSKRSHWMWFVFPQIDGLGRSSTAIHYAIKSKEEAIAYLENPILKKRLEQCTRTILALNNHTSLQIFGVIDNMKLQSSMTLFALISNKNSIYHQTLNKYFDGVLDHLTLKQCSEND